MIYKNLRDKLKEAVVNLNVSADHQDRWENGKWFGQVEMITMMMEAMGHKVDGQYRGGKDTKVVHIIYMTLDGEKIGECRHDVADEE